MKPKNSKEPKMPKELKAAKKVEQSGKSSSHMPSFDPITKVRDMAREAVNEGQYGASTFFNE
jgi:hypothetical protein